jgi:hypothetical protein
MKQAYPDTELDLFVARAMLELLSRSDNFDLPRRFRKQYFPTVKSPILNLVDMLPELIDIKDFNLYKETVDKYDVQVKRDPNFITVSQSPPNHPCNSISTESRRSTSMASV